MPVARTTRSPTRLTRRPLASAETRRMNAKAEMTAPAAVRPTPKSRAKTGMAGATTPNPTATANATAVSTVTSRGSEPKNRDIRAQAMRGGWSGPRGDQGRVTCGDTASLEGWDDDPRQHRGAVRFAVIRYRRLSFPAHPPEGASGAAVSAGVRPVALEGATTCPARRRVAVAGTAAGGAPPGPPRQPSRSPWAAPSPPWPCSGRSPAPPCATGPVVRGAAPGRPGTGPTARAAPRC